MKNVLMLVIALSMNISVLGSDFKNLRLAYPRAVEDAQLCEKLISILNKGQRSPVETAYYGALLCVQAKHGVSPLEKLRYFKTGKKFLEQAVALAPEDVEVRFLRLSIQHNTPSFLGYRSAVDQDRQFLQNNLSKITAPELRQLVKNLLDSLN